MKKEIEVIVAGFRFQPYKYLYLQILYLTPKEVVPTCLLLTYTFYL